MNGKTKRGSEGSLFYLPIDKYNYMCYNIRAGRKTMKSYSSREVIAMLKKDGWYLMNSEGSHHQFKHPTKPGKVTVKHPQKDIPPKTLASIANQSGIIFG